MKARAWTRLFLPWSRSVSDSAADNAYSSGSGWKRARPAVAMHVAVITVTCGILWSPGRWGRNDWDYFAHHYEAMRRCVLDYHQIPWWNPWSCGGMPLAANPQLGLISINFLFVLLVGTYPGLKLATVAHLLIGAEGARRLARQWMGDPLACAVAGFIFVANGAVALCLASGMLGVLVIAWVPWAISFLFRMEQDARWGILLGAAVALAILESMHYFAVHLMLIVGVLLGWRIWVCRRTGWSRQVMGGLWAAATVLTFAGVRLATSSELVLDFPRSRSDLIRVHLTPEVLARALLQPLLHMGYRVPGWHGNLGLGWHEFGCYIGLPAVALFIASLKSGWRWWHILAVAGLWLSVGNSDWYHPSAWMVGLPVLGTMRLATRWRVMATLGIGLACGAALSEWRTSSNRMARLFGTTLGGILAIDLGLNAWPVYNKIFINTPLEAQPAATDQPIVQTEVLKVTLTEGTQMLAMLQANYGVIYSYEPLIGVDQNPLSARLWAGHPDYQGEHWSKDGDVEVVEWSPSRIALKAPPGAEVRVNQNPGSYWVVNGNRQFASLRAVDRHEQFAVQAAADGRVELVVWPRSLRWGLVMTAVGMVALVLMSSRDTWLGAPATANPWVASMVG